MSDSAPIVGSYDVLVVGGSAGAAACALAAARAGASVMVLAPRAYLGDDIAATFDYWPRRDDAMACELARAVFSRGADPDATPPTPMHVKRTLEQALVAAGVTMLLNAHPAGVLRDAAGRLAGVVAANRAGLQAVLASQVVDATERGQVARQAGAAFAPWVGGVCTVTHVVLGLDPAAPAPRTPGSPLPAMVAPSAKPGEVIHAWRHELQVDLGDGSWSALAAATAHVRRSCWRRGLFQQSERLGLVWPDHLAGEPAVRDWPGCEAFPVAALEVEAGLHMLGPAARISRPAALRLARPTHLMAVGQRLGEAVASKPGPRAGAAGGASLVASCAGAMPLASGELRWLEGGLRPSEALRGEAPPRVAIDPRRIPRLGRYDVAVIGGGTGGAGAGIAAARAGARTVVCEAMPALGGVGTLGQISRYWYGNLVGFTREIDASVARVEGVEKLDRPEWSPVAKAQWYLDELTRGGGEAWLGAAACGVWMEGDRVRGVIIAGPHGFGLLEAAASVDATGCCDLAAAAGAPTKAVDAEHVAVQGVGLASVEPGAPYHNTDHSFSDDTDPVDATAFLVSSKVKFHDGFDLGQLVDSRERRQIHGEVTLGPADMLCDRRFPDSICLSSSNFDTHGFTIHPLFVVKPPTKERLWVYVPYRCLLPRGVEGLLVTGLGVSAHRDALPVIRMQGDVQNQGYAAGRAAAMAARAGVSLRGIDIKALQKHLVEIGNLRPEVLTDRDTFPVDDATLARAVSEGWDTHAGLAVCFDHADRARPLLRDAFDRAADPQARQRYALVLALMGDAHGAAVLRDALRGRPWDAGWNYRGMGQFGMSNSEMDAIVMALGACGDVQAWPVVLEKIDALGRAADPEFSHCRAVVEACEHLHRAQPHAGAAPALAALLRRPGMAGHDQTTLARQQAQLTPHSCEVLTRNRSLRELHLARGLFRCGDVEDDLGRATLERYARDLRGHYARHASAVLARSGAARRG